MFGDIRAWELTCVLEDLSLLCVHGLLHAYDLQEVRSHLIAICSFGLNILREQLLRPGATAVFDASWLYLLLVLIFA